jgi:serine/threonine protein phosphatase PrpC
MNDLLVSAAALTDVGMIRAGNEDAFLIADLTSGVVGAGSHTVGERGSLLVVSDGMGGAAAGEIASEMAVATVMDSLVKQPPDTEVAERLCQAAKEANQRIWQRALEDAELSGMGATLTAVLIDGTSAYVAQVGDSRAYLIRGNQIGQLTQDQSLVQLLVESGTIKPEQASMVPQNVIMQALGTQPSLRVTLTAVELCRNDRLLVCSDGLSNKVEAGEIQQVVGQSQDLEAACRQLVAMANQRGGEDNITVVLALLDGEGLAEPKPLEGSVKALSEGYFNEQLAALANGMNPPASPANQEFTLDLPEIDEEPTARPVEEEPVSHGAEPLVVDPRHSARKSYQMILVTALLGFLLIAATSYFFYLFYVR